MKKLLLWFAFILAAALPSTAQNTWYFVNNAPSGTCQSGTAGQITITTGLLYTCQSGTWAQTGGGGGGSGTVTSVALKSTTANLFSSVAGTAVTTNGFLDPDAQLALQAANCHVLGPASGSPAAPTCRATVNADFPTSLAPTFSAANLTNFPTFNQNTTGTAANITATSNGTLTTLSVLSLPYTQLTGTPTVPTSSSWPNAGTCTSGQYVSALVNGTVPTCAVVQYSQLGGTVTTWNQNTTGNAATATNISTNGSANQVWGMNSGGSAQGWQTVSGGGSTGSLTGSGLTTGDVYYVNSSGVLTLAEANASTTVPGVCVASSATVCVYSGVVTNGSWTAGGIIYVSDGTAGLLTQTEPSTSGHYVQIIGVATSTSAFLVMPSLNVGGIQ